MKSEGDVVIINTNYLNRCGSTTTLSNAIRVQSMSDLVDLVAVTQSVTWRDGGGGRSTMLVVVVPEGEEDKLPDSMRFVEIGEIVGWMDF